MRPTTTTGTTASTLRHSGPTRNTRTLMRLAAVGMTTAGLLVGGGLAATSAQAADTPPATISVTQAQAKAGQATMAPTTRAQRQAARQAVRDEVVERALSRVGSSYSAGAEGPRAFDCSGLTLFAWRAAGVDLTHYSYAQSQETKKISVKKALPGDLVFYFRNGARHVGLYVGKGMMVHASDYGVGVIKSPILGTPWTDAHFSGIGRVKLAA